MQRSEKEHVFAKGASANTGSSPNCVPLVHVRWNFKGWCFFFWRRLICPQNSSVRMFWYKDLNSSHFFPRFGALEHEANRKPDISATFIGSRKKFCERKRMFVCSARKRKPSVLFLSYRLNRFNRCSRWITTPSSNLELPIFFEYSKMFQKKTNLTQDHSETKDKIS